MSSESPNFSSTEASNLLHNFTVGAVVIRSSEGVQWTVFHLP